MLSNALISFLKSIFKNKLVVWEGLNCEKSFSHIDSFADGGLLHWMQLRCI